ncbi:MAG: hypothetical protein AAFR61_14585 [Bacteroidota bacterium]
MRSSWIISRSPLLLVTLWLLSLTLSSCSEEYVPFPRKYGFHRIDIPAVTQYQTFSNAACPFSFEYPEGGRISRESPDSCWTDIYFPAYDCTWHFTYRQAEESGKARGVHFEEYRGLIYKHSKKASQIKESRLDMASGKGVKFELYGNVGTPEQLFFHDASEQEIMMMSFYFNTAMKNDSLQPVIVHMKDQLDHMLESFTWENAL